MVQKNKRLDYQTRIRMYEAAKAEIARTAKTSAEYERRCIEAAKKFKI